VVILTQIANNKKSVLYLCEECAKKMGISVASSEEHTAEEDGAKAKSAAEDKNLRCPTCGLSYADFKQNGRLGCGDCYSAFSEPLEKVLTKLHGSTVHRGKVPQGIWTLCHLPVEPARLSSLRYSIMCWPPENGVAI